MAAGGLTELGEHSGEGVTRGVRNWRWPLSAAICSQLMIQAMVSGHPRSGAAFKILAFAAVPKISIPRQQMTQKEKTNFRAALETCTRLCT